MLDNARQYQADWRDSNNQNFEYYDGNQWTAAELAELKERGQQDTVLNIVRPTVDMMFAQYLERQADITLMGREVSDDGLGKIMTHMLKWLLDMADFDYYEGEVFMEGAVGGIGWFGVDVEEDEFGDDQIQVEQVPWEEMFWDPHARRPDFQDARYIHRVGWMDIDDVEELWDVEISHEDATAGWDDYTGQEAKAQEGSDPIEGGDHKPRRVPVIETWYKNSKKKLHQVIWTGNTFLVGGLEDSENENPHKADGDGIDLSLYPFIPFRFARDKEGLPQGVVGWMKPEQDSLNHLHSKWQWGISSRQIVAEDNAVEDIETLREEINKPDGIMLVGPGALADKRFQILDNLKDSQHLMQMMQFMIVMGQRVSGVNDATMGIGGVNSRSNQQEQTRIVQGAQMQARALTNLMLAKRQVARVALRMAAIHLKTPRISRVMEPNGDEQVTPLNQPFAAEDPETGESIEMQYNIADAMRYDVIMKTVPAFDSVRQQQMLLVTEAAKSGVIPPPIASRLIIELSNFHDKEKILQSLEQFEKQQAEALTNAGAPQ